MTLSRLSAPLASGQDPAYLVAFAHDEAAQATLTADDIPQRFRDLIIE